MATAVHVPTMTKAERANQRNALLAGFLGWTLDAFDFFLLVLVLDSVAKDLGRSRPDIALTLTASLAMRPVGALLFGLMADRYGRRIPLMVNMVFYSVIEVLSGLAPDYTAFFILRLLFGIGMGGEWGVGASLAMESVPARWRGFLSGVLQEGYALGYLARRARVLHGVSRVRLARDVLHRRAAGVALAVRARAGEGVGRVARAQGRTGRATRPLMKNWKLFVYLVLLIGVMGLMSHGTQDMYPTFLEQGLLHAEVAKRRCNHDLHGRRHIGGLTFGWLLRPGRAGNAR